MIIFDNFLSKFTRLDKFTWLDKKNLRNISIESIESIINKDSSVSNNSTTTTTTTTSLRAVSKLKSSNFASVHLQKIYLYQSLQVVAYKKKVHENHKEQGADLKIFLQFLQSQKSKSTGQIFYKKIFTPGKKKNWQPDKYFTRKYLLQPNQPKPICYWG